jgi:hypothetical protein
MTLGMIMICNYAGPTSSHSFSLSCSSIGNFFASLFLGSISSPLFALAFIITYGILALFLASVYYFDKKIYHFSLLAVILVASTVIFFNLGFQLHYCGIAGCTNVHLAEIAYARGDDSLCNLALEGGYSSVWHSPRFTSLSSFDWALLEPSSEEYCYSELPSLKGELALCEQVLPNGNGWLNARESCFGYFFKRGLDVDCLKIVEGEIRDECFYVLSLNTPLVPDEILL